MDQRTRQAKEALVIDKIRRKSGIDWSLLHDDPTLRAAYDRLIDRGEIVETGRGQTFPWLQCKIVRRDAAK